MINELKAIEKQVEKIEQSLKGILNERGGLGLP